MTLDEFWEHIHATKQPDPNTHAEALTDRLATLPAEDIVDFAYWWDRMMSESYRRDLWGAAYYANGGCSDDMFIDFRAWLILQGRDTFQTVVADPNTLLDCISDSDADPDLFCECYPASHAWDKAFGNDTDDAFNALYDARHPGPFPKRELGEKWDFDDPVQRKLRLPRFAGDD